ncbi:MAG: hypothetical protein K6G88_11325 [Lachnospiraceae bacterium]|nr:hypothetical protein [Lachnospiraceae bacterium]
MILNEVLEITQKSINIDGEEVYILENHMKKGVDELKNIIFLHRDEYMFSMLEKHLDFILSHKDFAIIFRPIKRKYITEWLPCIVYLYQKEWLRVSIQYANCLKCNWHGTIANPTDTDLYATMDNRFDIIKKMYELPFLKCPLCGNMLSGKAIWIDITER